ncbi:MAG: dihydrofolate reductase family protein [Paracoccaceae bacterium]
MTHFTLTVATSRDGFISRSTDEPPQAWASEEEQALFFRDVNAADWAVMGRNTHLAADRPERRRIIFSTQISGWQRPTQLWVDPSDLTPPALSGLVDGVHACDNGLILGGTRVHDWFLKHRAIHKVHLTIEPVAFGDGLPVFTTQTSEDPVEIFETAGFRVLSDVPLNAAGTRYLELVPSD